MAPPRGTNYTCDEDRHLCDVFIKNSNDPSVAANQRKDHFWSCVATTYNSSKPSTVMQDRNRRSLQCRIHTIQQAVSKLNECIKQIECRNQDGASELDVFNRAKQLLQQDANFRCGFKFDHVWTVMKDVARVAPKKRKLVNYCSSFQVEKVAESPIAPPPESASFAPNAGDENGSGGSSSQESKETRSSKRSKGEDDSSFFKTFKEESQKIRDLLMGREEKRQRIIDLQLQQLELQKRKIAFAQWKEENKILRMNLDTISDSCRREFFRKEQETIMQKRKRAMVPSNE